MMQQIPKFVPVALDRFEAPESFTLRGRKTGNESRPLTPIVEEVRCQPEREARSETDEKTCPEHVHSDHSGSCCTGDEIAPHCGASRSCDFVSRRTV
jgi:hypothetical protein